MLSVPVIFTVVIFVLAGCSQGSSSGNSRAESVTVTPGNPDANEILGLNSEADIFQWGDIIYTTNVEWVEKLELTKDEQIGEITKNSTNPDDFINGTANKLPVGTKIFSVKEDGGFLLVEYNQQLKKYLMLVEG
ncbi:hypothetical protein [Paenisporosarcina sp. NPDC076898]|uniref:hypothetical protein n=1 Tax=unclassified Paenisporosarcina TaxID=2642018 RepID=UPI003CFDAC3E